MTVDVVSVDNPLGQEFVLTVVLRGSGGRPVEVGGVGPYPPDRAGTFTVQIPRRAAAELGDGPVEVSVHLRPPAADRELEEPLDVVVGSLRLGSSP